MKSWWVGSALALGLGAVIGGASLDGPVLAQMQPEAQWLSDYEAARAMARQTGKPLFVVFR